MWTPAAFWSATTWDVSRAWDGYARSKGIETDTRLTKEDIEELKQWMSEND
jgi:hypothetical protein